MNTLSTFHLESPRRFRKHPERLNNERKEKHRFFFAFFSLQLEKSISMRITVSLSTYDQSSSINLLSIKIINNLSIDEGRKSLILISTFR